MNRSLKRLIFFLSLLALFAGAGFRFLLIAETDILEYDSAISILVATGHALEYDQIIEGQSAPLGQWARAGDWKRLVSIEPGRGLAAITHDLSQTDVHPPLYFWILHGWFRLFGVSSWSGHLLNVVFDLLTAAVISAAAYSYFRERSKAVLVGSLWLLSPIAIKTILWIRHYPLFTLMAILFAYLFYQVFYRSERVRFWSWQNRLLVAAAAGGMLTHYYFAFFILTGVLLVALRALAARGERVKILYLALDLVLAGALFALIFPEFLSSLRNYLTGGEGDFVFAPNLEYRLRTAARTLALLFSPAIVGLALAGLLLGQKRLSPAANILPLAWTGAITHPQPGIRSFTAWTLVFSILPTAGMVALYLSGIAEQHTFTAHYLGFLSPFVIFLAVLFLEAVGGFQGQRTPALTASLLLAGMLVLGAVPWVQDLRTPGGELENLEAEVVLLDNVQRGVWPSIVMKLDDSTQIFAASQEAILGSPQEWLGYFSGKESIYVSFLRHSNTKENTAAILSLLETRYRVQSTATSNKPGEWTITVYQINTE